MCVCVYVCRQGHGRGSRAWIVSKDGDIYVCACVYGCPRLTADTAFIFDIYVCLCVCVRVCVCVCVCHSQSEGRWELKYLKRFGYDKTYFSYEAGRRCRDGPGIWAFSTPKVSPWYLRSHGTAVTMVPPPLGVIYFHGYHGRGAVLND